MSDASRAEVCAAAIADTFGSACHGAGRLMSRAEAKRSVRGRSLIKEMRERGVHVMAAGMATVAEGIEEFGQLAALREMGCHFAQGYYFSRPVPADEAGRLFLDGADAVR